MSKDKIDNDVSQYNGYLARSREGASRGLEMATFCLGVGHTGVDPVKIHGAYRTHRNQVYKGHTRAHTNSSE